MHIPDGYLSPETCAAMYAAMVPAWWYSARRLANRLSSALVPFLGLGAAFAFVLMTLQVPVPNGTSAHGVGGTLLAITLGPEAAVVAVSVALAIQALFFGDGGILAYGANAFSAALAGPLCGYLAFVGLGRFSSFPKRLAAALAAYIGVNVTGLVASVELGIQPILFRTSDGMALYNPFGFAQVLPAMLLAHAVTAGPVEAAVTAFGLKFFRIQGAAFTARERRSIRPLAVLIVVLVAVTPVSALVPGAWGEWGLQDVVRMAGYLPSGMAHLTTFWVAPWAQLEPALSIQVGFVLAVLVGALVGAVSVACTVGFLTWIVYRHRHLAKEM